MTLIELLVVLGIVMMLAAVTIPRLRPDLDRARVREASREVQLYLSSARNLAITTGRSCGVQIERLANFTATAGSANVLEAGASMMLSQVESPVAYCGEAIPALVSVSLNNSLSTPTSAAINLSFTPAINQTLVNPGDTIQLGMQGPLYTITTPYPSNGVSLTATLDVSLGQSVPWPAGSPGSGPAVPYRFFRQPVKSSAAALQLPSPSAIDLTFSGPDFPLTTPAAQVQFWYNNANANTTPPYTFSTNDFTPIQIMFAPDGSVDRVYVDGQVSYPQTTICLLIGKRQGVQSTPATPDPSSLNLSDFNSLWVSINPRTGLIVTTDLAATSSATTTLTLMPGVVYASRAFARQSDPRGGD